MLLGMGREEGGGGRERERGKGRRRARVRTGKRVGTICVVSSSFIRHSNFNCVRLCVLLFNLKKKKLGITSPEGEKKLTREGLQ